MLKIYCDRCGEEVSSVYGNAVVIDISNLSLFSDSVLEKKMHLCGDCFNDFLDHFIFDQKEDSDGKE